MPGVTPSFSIVHFPSVESTRSLDALMLPPSTSETNIETPAHPPYPDYQKK